MLTFRWCLDPECLHSLNDLQNEIPREKCLASLLKRGLKGPLRDNQPVSPRSLLTQLVKVCLSSKATLGKFVQGASIQ